MNYCTSARVAVERLSEVVSEHVLCVKEGTGYSIYAANDLDLTPVQKTSAKETLAYLADIAMRAHMDRGEVADMVRWEGDVPVSGMPGWQEVALCWLRYGTLSHPHKKEERIGPRRRSAGVL